MSSLPTIGTGLADVIAQLGRSVTHRRKVAGAFNSTTMTRATTVTTATVTMIREPTTAQTIAGAGPDVDERVYRCLQADVAAIEADDEITDGSVTLQVVAVEQDADSLTWRIVARRKK